MAKVSLREGLSRGLRKKALPGRGSPEFARFDFLAPRAEGARGHTPIEDAITDAQLTAASITKDFPFPQFVLGKSQNYLFTESAIYPVSADRATIASVQTIYNPATGTASAITAGGAWHVADFHKTFVAANGSCMVWKSDWVNSSRIYATASGPGTVCGYKGRLIAGGFNNSFFNNEVDTYINTMLTMATSYWGHNKDETLASGFGENWVYWSNIGELDLLRYFFPDIAASGVEGDAAVTTLASRYGSTDRFSLWDLKKNQFGFMPMEWAGKVHQVKPMRDFVLVYGEGGVSAIIPHSEPQPTFGLEEQVLQVGISQRGAVGGDNKQHLFIDNTGFAWMIDSKLQLTQLDYREFFEPMLEDDNLLITFSARDREFHIATEEEGYVLNAQGLSRALTMATSLFFSAGSLLGIQCPYEEVDTNRVVNPEFKPYGSQETFGWRGEGTASLTYDVDAETWTTDGTGADGDRMLYQKEVLTAGVEYTAVIHLSDVVAGTGGGYIGAGDTLTIAGPLTSAGVHEVTFTAPSTTVGNRPWEATGFGLWFIGTMQATVHSIYLYKTSEYDLEDPVAGIATLETGIIDGGTRQAKTLKSIEFVGTHTSPVTIHIGTRQTASDDFTYLAEQALDEDDILRQEVTEVDFKLRIQSPVNVDQTEDLTIDDLVLVFKDDAKQSIGSTLNA